jgi:DNA transformation protein
MDDDDIRDLFAGLGRVTIRRMFGGKGIYFNGLIVALDLGDEILLKADAESAPLFAAEGCRQWTYEGKNRPVAMPYWSIPDSAIDDPDEMARWAGRAWEAALRSKKT